MAFMLIFSPPERELFEAQRAGFLQYILDCYYGAHTCHYGKLMYIYVTTPAQLKQIKRLMFIKKRYNLKPFTYDGALCSMRGPHCDLCAHYPARFCCGVRNLHLAVCEAAAISRCAAQMEIAHCCNCPDYPCLYAPSPLNDSAPSCTPPARSPESCRPIRPCSTRTAVAAVHRTKGTSQWLIHGAA